MCGRYSLTTPLDAMRQLFDLPAGALNAWSQPRFNIAPSQSAPVLRLGGLGGGLEGGGPELVAMTWGLVPSWSKDSSSGGQINARSETAGEKPTFRGAYQQRRCLIPADGFYEWQKIDGGKQPYWISRADGAPFVFAGLWETWNAGKAGEMTGFTVLTTTATETLHEIHHRMPVIIGKQNFAAWLDPGQSPQTELFAPEQAPDMQARPVSARVNSPRNSDAACLETARIIPEQGRLF
ncbi:MAG: SOS response-associated peptidase [Alphaproteobacteria bacterium]|nr:SOS response-associated peptidase [Alphaproteobacteria bacterium]